MFHIPLDKGNASYPKYVPNNHKNGEKNVYHLICISIECYANIHC